MSHFKKSNKAFTLVEILASTILLVVAAAAFFTLFISTAKLRTYSLNEFRMSINASSWLEKVRTGSTSGTEYSNLTTQATTDLNDGASIFQEDYANSWIIANEGNVDIANPGDNTKGALYTTEENVSFGSGVNFKKITATVLWDEKA